MQSLICPKCADPDSPPQILSCVNNHVSCLKSIVEHKLYPIEDMRYMVISAATSGSIDCLRYLYEEACFPWVDALSPEYTEEDYCYDEITPFILEYINSVKQNWSRGIYPHFQRTLKRKLF